MRTRLLALVLLGACACSDEPDMAPPAIPLPQAGEPCGWAWAWCVDEASVSWCAEGIWTEQPCDEYCASLGPGVSSMGCAQELELGHPTQLCMCAAPPEGCTPGQGSCDDEDTISWCTQEWTWSTSSCVEVCATQSLLSLGCDEKVGAAVCLCTNTGTACDAEPSVCADEQRLSVCEGGTWTLVDCVAECGGEAVCDPAATEEAACVCG